MVRALLIALNAAAGRLLWDVGGRMPPTGCRPATCPDVTGKPLGSHKATFPSCTPARPRQPLAPLVVGWVWEVTAQEGRQTDGKQSS